MSTAMLGRIKLLKDQVPYAPIVACGKLVRGIGLTLEAVGCQMPVGSQCLIQTMEGEIEAEVVGFAENITYLMPTEAVKGIVPGSRVQPLNREQGLAVGMELLGRVVDGNGQPLDGLGPIKAEKRVPLSRPPMNPLLRKPIKQPLDVGVRAINSIVTVGLGQRMGLFAGSGVGKSVLMGMMTRGTAADVVVVGLVGERGREVKEFIQDILGEEERAKSVVVAAPADTSPLMRLKGCELNIFETKV
jgi:flagellum-specific ATP synthase